MEEDDKMSEIKMAAENDEFSHTLPVGPLGLVALPGCEELAERVDAYLAMWRKGREQDFNGYK